MAKSAITWGREARRRATTLRITARAQELTLEHGLDGFTMAELATAADVSRRTLFNHFPSKLDAVLGAVPELDPDLLATFHAGGPHGDLVRDVTVLAQSLLRVEGAGREDVLRGRRVVAAEPRLLAAAHARFRLLVADYLQEIRIREGDAFDPEQARTLITVLAALVDQVLDDFVADPDTEELAELFATAVERARAALAPTPT